MGWDKAESGSGLSQRKAGFKSFRHTGTVGLTVMLAAALLSACAPDSRTPTAVTTDLTTKSFVSGQGQTVTLPQTTEPSDSSKNLSSGQTQAPDRQRSAVQQAALPAVDARPNRFLGLRDQDLRSLLGEPTQLRREAQAQIWQYEEDLCVLDVYLYPQDGQNRVVFLEARDQAAQEFPAASCLTPLLQAQISG
ncbi:hypothetical protein ACTL6U_12185 [Rhodovibrionaceae bacterium A322]